MKLYSTTLNTHGDHIHPLAFRVVDKLCAYCPEYFVQVDSIRDADVLIINAPACPPYRFDKSKEETIEKPIIVFSDADGYAPDCEPEGFGPWVRSTDKIKAYFYREWWSDYKTPFLVPLVPFDLIVDRPVYPVHSFSEFCDRKLDLFFSQSVHVQSRKNFYMALKDRPSCFINDAYENMLPTDDMLRYQQKSKITIALEGSGIKSTRHCEAPINSVMAMPDLIMNEAYPWIDQLNCLRLPYQDGGEGSFIKPEGRGVINVATSMIKLQMWLDQPQTLYRIYLEGVHNADNYLPRNYYRNHVAPNILKYV